MPGDWGSSPRLRGALLPPAQWRREIGIIPALAGSTFRLLHQARHSGDHPRACGEHCVMVVNPTRALGSSPRLRGARPRSRCWPRRCGIIPALAGSTTHGRPTHTTCRDHPRACGEHLYDCVQYFILGGSSPRLRGALEITGSPLLWIGIIPALAGSTGWRVIGMATSGDHPRACGEHAVMAAGAFLI